jgi:hypothetical protein
MTSKLSAKFTLWCNRIIGLAVIVLIFCFPWVLKVYQCFRALSPQGNAAVLCSFYLCVPLVLYALWCVDRIITNLLKDLVFVQANVSYVRRIRWCCAGVSLICIPAACFYQPLIFVVVIMAFLALVVSLVKNILAAAVELREENDLTI